MVTQLAITLGYNPLEMALYTKQAHNILSGSIGEYALTKLNLG